MPDLMTHLCTAQLARRGALDRRFPLFALGAILPDILSRPAHILVPSAYPFVKPLHSPVVCLLYCALVSLLFTPSVRRAAFGCLLAGTGLHLLFDSFQIQIGPEYLWAFPFSWGSGHLGLFWPEQALLVLPVTIAATAAVTAWRRAGFRGS